MRIYQTVKRHNKQTFKQQKRHKRNTIDIEHPSRDKAENGAVTRQNAPRDEPQCKLGNDVDPTAGRNDHVSKHVTVHVHTQRRGKSLVAVNQVASRTDKHIEEFSNCNSAPCKSKNPVSTLKESQKLEQLQVEPFPTDISQSPVIGELQMSQGTQKCTKNANEISSEEQILPMKDPEKITMDENHDIKSTVSSSEEESLPMKHPVVVESCKTSNSTWESRGKQAIVMSDQERMVENPNAIEVVQHVTLKDSKNAIRVEKQKSNKPGTSSDAHRLKSSQKEAKVTKLLLMVFVGFCVCWSPIVLTNVTFTAANRKLGYLDLVAAVFACLSTAINPFIYAATNRMFRKTFVEILLMCKR
ncbi:D(2)-like dopamine receptor [Nematostella vectensis]|uniref:D(2)-like dopamine receptor n=1 Tax=Nematostella vectensis TaxID=45351 RepID=UPI0020775875|nr:D(2)-like dopamine receptor [Nematostella vectensis]